MPGEPVPKGRPRFAVVRGRAMAFTPDKTRVWEETIRVHALKAFVHCPWRKELQGDYGLHVVVRTSQKGKRRGDLDNHAKAASDSLNDVLFDDDSSVSTLLVQFDEAKDGDVGIWVRVWKKDRG